MSEKVGMVSMIDGNSSNTTVVNSRVFGVLLCRYVVGVRNTYSLEEAPVVGFGLVRVPVEVVLGADVACEGVWACECG